MAIVSQNLRSCPTRIDGQPVLFAHKVTTSQCADRRRGRYHKCFTCVHNHAHEKNGYAIPEKALTSAAATPARPKREVFAS